MTTNPANLTPPAAASQDSTTPAAAAGTSSPRASSSSPSSSSPAGAERWIVIPHWHGKNGKDGFQHYRDRDPVWVKAYTRLMRDDDYLRLTLAERGLLLGLWLEYASTDGQLLGDSRSLARRLAQKITTKQLERLNHAGFIEFSASKPLALRYQHASPETETEKNSLNGSRPNPAPSPRGRASRLAFLELARPVFVASGVNAARLLLEGFTDDAGVIAAHLERLAADLPEGS
jgi:hypothetical protein